MKEGRAILLAFVILAVLQIESFFVDSSPARRHGCKKSKGRSHPKFMQGGLFGLNTYGDNVPKPYDSALNPYDNSVPNPYQNSALNTYDNSVPHPGNGLIPNIVDVNVLGAVHVGVG